MPRADAYIANLFPLGASKTVVRNKVLTPLEVISLTNALRADAADFYYSGWVSFLDALNGINKGFYTWATVKLYYSVFYAFRASLAIDDVCAFHIGRSSFTVLGKVGATPNSCTDNGTHKTVLKTFQRTNPSHPLVSQQIDLRDAIDWLVDIRESANYGQPRFQEPNCGSEFSSVVANGLRKSLNAYVADSSFPYMFDPDHAVVAYPLRTLQLIGAQLLTAALPGLSEDEQKFPKNRAMDSSGSLAVIIAELKRLAVLTV
jgi:hypothetical protein